MSSADVEDDGVELIALNPTNASSSNAAQEDPDVYDDELLLLPPPKSRHWLYATHAVAQFSEIAWQFSIAFFLSALTNHQSLFWLACYGVSRGAAVTVGMPLVGSWIDSTKLSRWEVVQRTILLETISVAIASIAVIILLQSESIHLGPMVVLNIFGALSQVCDQALIVAFERDWIVEMSRNDGTWLSTTNVCMRQIDLSAKVLGPALAASVALPLLVAKKQQDGTDDWSRAAWIIGMINILALMLQYVGSAIIYKLAPVLSRERSTKEISTTHTNDSTSPQRCCHGIKVYLSLPASGAGLALAVLYLNGLTFGNGIMTAHLLHYGMSVQHVGLWRGLAAVVGLAGTWVFRWSPLTLKWTAFWSILYEFACLLVAALSLVPTNDATTSVGLLLAGVLASRTGLWVFDLSVTQLQQETVPKDVRGVVGGVQQSLNAVCSLLCFAVGLAFPENFDVFLLTACGSVGLAVVFYLCAFLSLN